MVHTVPKQKVLKSVRNELNRLTKYANLSLSETHTLWNETYGRYMRMSKKAFSSLKQAKKKVLIRADTEITYDEELKLRKNVIYGLARKEFKGLEHTKNELANDIEYRAKSDQIRNLLSGNDVFYLCSSHRNPAKDHADWEGKVYITEDWQSKVSSEEATKIVAYIRNHNTRTVEWVTGEPVYLVTRPNCKHYLIPVTVTEVLNNSTRKLLKEHDAYMEDEKEQSYEYGQYKDYYERLKMLTYLKSMFDAEDLDKDIKETRILVRKWGYRAKNK